ncbi:MAG: DUF308 domain-containing protein [Ardenticatenaceae bacterium]|nr:DUF308 domain-containing protein [Ardenticatenaceae bacterium]
MQATYENNNPIRSAIADSWWVFLLQGIATVLLGVFLVIRPAITLILLVQFMGATFLVNGIFGLIAAVFGGLKQENRWLGLIISILGILAGLVVFLRPLFSTLLTELVIVNSFAFISLMIGIANIVRAVQLRDVLPHPWWLGLSGVASLLFAGFLLFHPLLSISVLIVMIALFALFGGIGLILLAFQVRRLA